VHLDAKASMDKRWQAVDAEFVSPRLPVYWAGYSQVEATLALIKMALSSGEKFLKIVLISGSCYPILPISKLERLFLDQPELNYIRYVNARQSPLLMSHISRRHWRDAILPFQFTARFPAVAKIEKAIRKIYTESFGRIADHWTFEGEPFHGSSWWALSPEAAQFALDFIARRPDFSEKYRKSFAADEHVFHTIIGNSPFAAKSTGEFAYEGRGTWRAANLHHIDPSLSKWFSIDDFDDVVSSAKYFVRKVNTAKSAPLLDALDLHAAAQEAWLPVTQYEITTNMSPLGND
jgi:hypothetical protein